MGALAERLDEAAPRGGGRDTESLVDRILSHIDDVDDLEAVRRALSDWDEHWGRFRVSNAQLSEMLTQSGHAIGVTAIRKYRAQMGYGE